MPKRSRKRPAKGQLGRSIVDRATGVSKAVKSAPNKAQPAGGIEYRTLTIRDIVELVASGVPSVQILILKLAHYQLASAEAE